MTDAKKSAARSAAMTAREAKLPKRFYQDVATKAGGGEGAALLLDGKTVRTPGKAPLVLPSRALAEAIAGEWRAQGERIDPATMPLTKLANSAIDGVAGRAPEVIDDIVAYASADLLCYRAGGPRGLVEVQGKYWDPVLAWAKEALAAPLVKVDGIVPAVQPEGALDKIKTQLKGFDAFSLAALHVMTALSGSALLALAVALGRLTPEKAWQAANVDEDWQISQWGEDAEAASRRQARWRDFSAAARLLRLV